MKKNDLLKLFEDFEIGNYGVLFGGRAAIVIDCCQSGSNSYIDVRYNNGSTNHILVSSTDASNWINFAVKNIGASGQA